MQHTAIKQIKYNRGQVTDKLSERSDMGLQNACGTVYNNIYINRYGQLQNAPCLEMATTNGGSYIRNIVAIWRDEISSGSNRSVYYPIALNRGVGSKISLKIYPPIITERIEVVTPVLNIPTGEEDKKVISEKTDLSSPIANYTVDRPWNSIGAKVLQFGSNFVAFGQDIKPWLFNIISDGIKGSSTKIFYAWKTQITGSTATATVTEHYRAFMDENNNVFFSRNAIEPGTLLGSFWISSGIEYNDMQQMLDLGGGATVNLSISGGIVKISAYISGVEASNVTPLDISDDFKRTTYTLSSTPAVDDNVYDSDFVIIGVVSSVGVNSIDFNNTTNDRYGAGDTTHEITDYGLTLRVKDDYFDGVFDNIFVRGLNIQAPAGFTPPTSGYYIVYDDAGITTKKIITIKRNNAGSAFTQDLVGQVIDCPQLSGAVQVREVVDANTLKAYVLSPLITANDNTTEIDINFDSSELTSKWLFGYEKAFSDINGYPDSATYVNQRLVFGGNDKWGNLIAASRVGVINDFNPNDATESDSFSVSISAPQACRIVDFVQSNDELRIATTYGEYAVSLGAFTPSGIIQQGFSLRSQVGVKLGSSICDCGGLTAYVSNDGSAIHCTQFSLLQNKYSPISLTSQTENIIKNCSQLVYLRNRDNDEGNLLIGRNSDGSIFGISIDTNSGLNAAYNIYSQNIVNSMSCFGGKIEGKIVKLFALENVLFAQFLVQNTTLADMPISMSYIVKLSMNRIFDLSYGYNQVSNNIQIPLYIADLIFPDAPQGKTSGVFLALYKDGNNYSFIAPTGYECDDYETDNAIATLKFADDIDQSKIITAGFVRQTDWRSVELSVGLGTRELNKKIVKLSSVIEPIKFYGDGDYYQTRYTISESDTYKFLDLVANKETNILTQDEIIQGKKKIYTEDGDMSWRRAFDNPSRELYYGIRMFAPFLVKSTTALLEYDDVS